MTGFHLSLILGAGTIITAWLVTRTLIRFAPRLGLVDIPNARSSHSRITPRGGGIAVVASWIAALVIGIRIDGADSRIAILLIVTALPVALVGLIDDHRGLPSWLRLCVHLGTGAAFVGLASPYGWLGATLAVLMISWLTNLYNFMDGIDGLAGAEAVTVGLGLAILASGATGPGDPRTWAGLLACASLGFLFCNWRPALIFMGDVSSGFLGFTLASIALMLDWSGRLPIASSLVLLGTFMVDASVTLIVRLMRGENIFQAHRTHVYQRLAIRLGRHDRVSLGYVICNLLWLFPLAASASRYPQLGWGILAVAYLPLLIAAVILGAGKPLETPVRS